MFKKLRDRLAEEANRLPVSHSGYSCILKTCDMHTAGEAVRIVEQGFPKLKGNTILEKRMDAKLNYDQYRSLLMNEPRGHKDMYGVILTEPTHPDAHIAALFIHNEGYSTMCGHACIALGRYAVDKGYVVAKAPETDVVIECPCGLVKTQVAFHNGQSGCVRFQSVPAFVFQSDIEVKSELLGNIKVDIAYGGAFYAIVSVEQLNMNFESTPLSKLVETAAEITEMVKSKVKVYHPDYPDLGFIYGTILTDGLDSSADKPSKNICVFADREVDRSPTGSGVTARMALQYKHRNVSLNEEKEFESVLGTKFKGKVVQETYCGDWDAVIVEVSGMAYYTGDHTFKLEKDDPFPRGFLLHP